MRCPTLALAFLALAAALPAQTAGLRWGPVTVGGDADLIWQGYPSFAAAYSGPLSLPAAGEFHNTRVFTLSTSTALAPGWCLELDVQAANGLALGGATGLAGITNLDVTHNLAPNLLPQVYLARLYLERSAGGGVVRVGRLDLTDEFDANAALGDDHDEFMNWSFNTSPAWDYAADTRGYTDAVEWEAGPWRMAYALLPVTVNGMRLDWLSSQMVIQRDFHWHRITIRPLAYAEHAPLGRYATAGLNVEGDHRWRWKPGGGLSADARLTRHLRAGIRLGVNDDQVEEYAYTEAGNTASAGLAWQGGASRWGMAVASNGISAAHAAYLARGGEGFLLGDGGLAYGREWISEAYYLRRLRPHVQWGPDLQLIGNPGYNRARGPVWVFGLRMHASF
ncbi:MAG: carbohydrate porin [Terriglobales bacterium]